MAEKKTAFEKRCLKAAQTTGVEVDFFQGVAGDEMDAFEDDGCLHIQDKDGLRACFDVGRSQLLGGASQNERTLAVLKALKLEKKFYNDRVVVAEDDDDDDYCCPHCGRSD